jgi:hypothetical protein
MVISGPSGCPLRSHFGWGKRKGSAMYVPRVDGLVTLNDRKPRGGMFRAFAILTEVLRHAMQRDHSGERGMKQ